MEVNIPGAQIILFLSVIKNKRELQDTLMVSAISFTRPDFYFGATRSLCTYLNAMDRLFPIHNIMVWPDWS